MATAAALDKQIERYRQMTGAHRVALLEQPLRDTHAAFAPLSRFALEGFSFVRRAFLLFYGRSNSTTEPRKAL